MDSFKKSKIRFDQKIFQRIKTQKYSYINSEIQEWRGYGEIGVGSHSQVEKYEKGNYNNICKGY